jgi:glycosyltransferase involved in cell wall biosynthesis
LSFARINSHKVFAKKVLGRLEELNPDLIYCSAPPNYLFKFTSTYKKNHPQVKLIYELGDLWPETLPLQGRIKKLASPILKIWTGIRDKNIGHADHIIYECQMFSDVVSKAHPGVSSEVIYLCKEDYYKGSFAFKESSIDPLRFAYVGSINNIIDIDLIVEFMKQITKKRNSELVIIGGGESAERLFKLCGEAHVKVEDHSIVYDEDEKHRILSGCQFGLNIMKDSVAVGATMKSLEYFHEGLILVNNIKADTEQIVDKYRCGYNISGDLMNTINHIADLDMASESVMRRNSRDVYESLFSEKIVKEKYTKVFNRIGA